MNPQTNDPTPGSSGASFSPPSLYGASFPTSSLYYAYGAVTAKVGCSLMHGSNTCTSDALVMELQGFYVGK
ncbi:MAG TPA: hypothetical protein VIY49_19775 [Bryobacteraceae bacterium]